MNIPVVALTVRVRAVRVALRVVQLMFILIYFHQDRRLRWRSSGPPTQLIVFTNSAETKPFTQLNSRYLIYS